MININSLFNKVEQATVPNISAELIKDMSAHLGKAFMEEFIQARFNLLKNFNQQNNRVTMLKSQGTK